MLLHLSSPTRMLCSWMLRRYCLYATAFLSSIVENCKLHTTSVTSVACVVVRAHVCVFLPICGYVLGLWCVCRGRGAPLVRCFVAVSFGIPGPLRWPHSEMIQTNGGAVAVDQATLPNAENKRNQVKMKTCASLACACASANSRSSFLLKIQLSVSTAEAKQQQRQTSLCGQLPLDQINSFSSWEPHRCRALSWAMRSFTCRFAASFACCCRCEVRGGIEPSRVEHATQ